MNLLELLRDADRKLDTGEITIGEYEKMIAPLKDAVPVVHGRWEMVEGELAFWDMCSVCGRKILHRTPYYDFCPNCGADMRKDGDGE